jgi:hypothetical protein
MISANDYRARFDDNSIIESVDSKSKLKDRDQLLAAHSTGKKRHNQIESHQDNIGDRVVVVNDAINDKLHNGDDMDSTAAKTRAKRESESVSGNSRKSRMSAIKSMRRSTIQISANRNNDAFQEQLKQELDMDI